MVEIWLLLGWWQNYFKIQIRTREQTCNISKLKKFIEIDKYERKIEEFYITQDVEYNDFTRLVNKFIDSNSSWLIRLYICWWSCITIWLVLLSLEPALNLSEFSTWRGVSLVIMSARRLAHRPVRVSLCASLLCNLAVAKHSKRL